jgi:hypothetical protein
LQGALFRTRRHCGGAGLASRGSELIQNGRGPGVA